MKNILIALMICPSVAFGWDKKTNNMVAGGALMVGGAGIVAGGYSVAHNTGNNKAVPLYVAGGAMFLSGAVMGIKAMIPHKERRISFTGNGFSYKICRR